MTSRTWWWTSCLVAAPPHLEERRGRTEQRGMKTCVIYFWFKANKGSLHRSFKLLTPLSSSSCWQHMKGNFVITHAAFISGNLLENKKNSTNNLSRRAKAKWWKRWTYLQDPAGVRFRAGLWLQWKRGWVFPSGSAWQPDPSWRILACGATSFNTIKGWNPE